MDPGELLMTSLGRRSAAFPLICTVAGAFSRRRAKKKGSEWGHLWVGGITTSFVMPPTQRWPLTEHGARHTVSEKWWVHPPCHVGTHLTVLTLCP